MYQRWKEIIKNFTFFFNIMENVRKKKGFPSIFLKTKYKTKVQKSFFLNFFIWHVPQLCYQLN